MQLVQDQQAHQLQRHDRFRELAHSQSPLKARISGILDSNMLLMLWHSALDMEKYDKAWHEQDMKDELQELVEAPNILYKWSELSDVSYTYSRGKWSGHNLDLPISKIDYYTGILYMYPKYTLRYLFFRRAGRKLDRGLKIKAVRNPKKTHKLHHIASSYKIDENKFQQQCQKQLKYWLLIP